MPQKFYIYIFFAQPQNSAQKKSKTVFNQNYRVVIRILGGAPRNRPKTGGRPTRTSVLKRTISMILNPRTNRRSCTERSQLCLRTPTAATLIIRWFGKPLCYSRNKHKHFRDVHVVNLLVPYTVVFRTKYSYNAIDPSRC